MGKGRSKVHPSHKTKYRVRNWNRYDQALRQRGDITLWLTPAAIAAWTHLVVDATGVGVFGEGEWAAAKWGGRGKRGWRKLHVAVDEDGFIVAAGFTDKAVADATALPELLDQVMEPIERVTAHLEHIERVGRRRWRVAVGHHEQARAENTFGRYKSAFGGRMKARNPAAPRNEALMGWDILNRMAALGQPDSHRVDA